MEENIATKIGESGKFSELERELYSTDVDERSFWRKVSDPYFTPKSIERWKNGKIYEDLGVKYVQKLVMGTVGKLFRKLGADEDAGIYFIGKRPNLEALRTFEAGTRFNELIHAPQIAWNSYELAKHLGDGNYGGAIFWGALLLLNTSCTMLQRYNRARTYNVMERLEEREKMPAPYK